MTSALPSGVYAVLRCDTAAAALTVARALAPTRVGAIEVTMTVPSACDVIATLVKDGVRRVGAGTVRTVQQVRDCVAAGAEFAVAPHTDEDVIAECVRLGLPAVPGAVTPSEIIRAIKLGATGVKVFPVGAVGGVDYIRAIREPLPDLALVVSGGISPDEVRQYVDAGAVGVCLGSALWRHEDVAVANIEKVRRYAERVLEVALAA